MKINDVIVENQQLEEGPIWQGIKGAFSKNPIAGAKAGYQQGQGQAASNAAADVAIKKWNAIAGQLNQAGTPATAQQFANFVKQAAPTSTLPAPTEADMTPKGVQEYLRKAAAQHIANSALGTPAPAPAAAPATTPEPAAAVEPAAEPEAPAAPTLAPPTMTKDQISQWVNRNSDDAKSLKSFLDGIGGTAADVPAPAAPAPAPKPNFGQQTTGYASQTMNAPTGIPATNTMVPTNTLGSKPAAPAAPAGPKVTAGGPTPEERAKLDQLIQQASAKQGVAEASIPYALSAANYNAEFERQHKNRTSSMPAGGGYRGRVELDVESREDYIATGQALSKAAKSAGQHIEYGLSGGVMKVFSDSMTTDELDTFIDDTLENFDQGVAEETNAPTKYRATVEYGPTAADAHFVTVKASSTDEAYKKVEAWCKKNRVRNPMITINGADKPVAEDERIEPTMDPVAPAAPAAPVAVAPADKFVQQLIAGFKALSPVDQAALRKEVEAAYTIASDNAVRGTNESLSRQFRKFTNENINWWLNSKAGRTSSQRLREAAIYELKKRGVTK